MVDKRQLLNTKVNLRTKNERKESSRIEQLSRVDSFEDHITRSGRLEKDGLKPKERVDFVKIRDVWMISDFDEHIAVQVDFPLSRGLYEQAMELAKLEAIGFSYFCNDALASYVEKRIQELRAAGLDGLCDRIEAMGR